MYIANVILLAPLTAPLGDVKSAPVAGVAAATLAFATAACAAMASASFFASNVVLSSSSALACSASLSFTAGASSARHGRAQPIASAMHVAAIVCLTTGESQRRTLLQRKFILRLRVSPTAQQRIG